MKKFKQGQTVCICLGETFKVLRVVKYKSLVPPLVLCVDANQSTNWPRFPVPEEVLVKSLEEFNKQFGSTL